MADGNITVTVNARADEVERMQCLINGLRFDALGEPRTRYVRVSLGGNHCVMSPSEGDNYLADARACAAIFRRLNELGHYSEAA